MVRLPSIFRSLTKIPIPSTNLNSRSLTLESCGPWISESHPLPLPSSVQYWSCTVSGHEALRHACRAFFFLRLLSTVCFLYIPRVSPFSSFVYPFSAWHRFSTIFSADSSTEEVCIMLLRHCAVLSVPYVDDCVQHSTVMVRHYSPSVQVKQHCH